MIDRVVATRVEVETARPRVRLGVAAAVVAAAAVAAIVIALVRSPAPRGPRTGDVAPAVRTQVRIANGTAVVEAGAAIAWDGAAIAQRAGTVYYRIDRPVAITTPHGVIRAANASGRVAIGATTVVTIDVGDAVVGQVPVTAGGRAELP
jgi:hypothetical protein